MNLRKAALIVNILRLMRMKKKTPTCVVVYQNNDPIISFVIVLEKDSCKTVSINYDIKPESLI